MEEKLNIYGLRVAFREEFSIDGIREEFGQKYGLREALGGRLSIYVMR
ncbi:hypothetical protein [Peribacillus deserti]|nr:hypothetical protein [Peribacillus deserti]